MNETHTYRFLVADDDAIGRRFMQSILKSLGAEVDTAANGEDVLLAVADTDYDVIFMDVHMPVMDGIEAMQALKSALPPEDLPTVVALTGSSDESTLKRCIAAGMSDYLVKPVDTGTIRLWIEQWAGERAAPDLNRDRLLNMSRIRELKDLESSASTESVVADMIALFRLECPIQIDELKSALHNNDAERIRELSHKLKGSLLNLGLLAAAGVCERLEHFAPGEDPAPFLALILRLEELYDRSYEEFSSYLRSA